LDTLFITQFPIVFEVDSWCIVWGKSMCTSALWNCWFFSECSKIILLPTLCWKRPNRYAV